MRGGLRPPLPPMASRVLGYHRYVAKESASGTSVSSERTTRPAQSGRASDPQGEKRSLLDFPLTPGALIFGWWTLCFALFFLNWPIPYTRPNFGLVVLLWLATTAVSLAFYRNAVRRKSRSQTIDESEEEQLTPPGDLIPRLGAVFALLLLPTVVVTYTGFSFSNLGAALSDTGSTYFATSMNLGNQAQGARLGLTAIMALVNIFALTSLPYFTYIWTRYRRRGIWLLAAIVPYAAMAIFSGRDYYIGLPATLMVFSALAGSRGRVIIRPTKALGALALTLSIGFFLAVRRGSRAEYGKSNLTLDACGAGTICDRPPPRGLAGFISGYATQGFEGLGFALDGEWHFGNFVGHTPAIAGILRVDLSSTISAQLDGLGWSSTGYWSTGLARIANDVPWILVPLVVGIAFWLFGNLWRIAKYPGADPITLAVFAYTGYLLIFMPQNLTLAIDGPRYLAYVFLFLVWLLQRVRRRTPAGERSVSKARRGHRTTPPVSGPQSQGYPTQSYHLRRY